MGLSRIGVLRINQTEAHLGSSGALMNKVEHITEPPDMADSTATDVRIVHVRASV